MKAVSLGKQKKKSLPWRIVSGLANTALLIILALFVYLFLAFPMQMKGHSMEPAVAEKSLLLLNKIQYRFVSPKQFDVIAFQIKDSDELQIKRIIACPGDCISIKEGMIYPLLVRLEKKNYISSTLRPSPLGPRRKYYSITDEGLTYLHGFINCWNQVQKSVNEILNMEESL